MAQPNPNSPDDHSDSPASGAGNTSGSDASGKASDIGKDTNAADSASTQEKTIETHPEERPQSLAALNIPVPRPESLPSVMVRVDEKPVVKEPSLPIIGFNLSSFVLFIISGFILFLAIYLMTNNFDASSLMEMPTDDDISDSIYARKIELFRMIQEEKKGYREFTTQITQMVLVNLLLPILTAILGYIFASNKNNNA